MNYSIETQDRKTRKKALTYTFLIACLLFGGLLATSSGTFSKISETVKELVSGDQVEEEGAKSADLSKRKRA